MHIKEARSFIQGKLTLAKNMGDKTASEVYIMTLNALMKEERRIGDSITLTQSEAMKRDHIYICDLQHPERSNYALVDQFHFPIPGKPWVITLVEDGYKWKNYGKTWIAYKEKP